MCDVDIDGRRAASVPIIAPDVLTWAWRRSHEAGGGSGERILLLEEMNVAWIAIGVNFDGCVCARKRPIGKRERAQIANNRDAGALQPLNRIGHVAMVRSSPVAQSMGLHRNIAAYGEVSARIDIQRGAAKRHAGMAQRIGGSEHGDRRGVCIRAKDRGSAQRGQD